MVKSIGYSSRGHRFNSQYPQWQLTTVCNVSSKRSNTLTQTYMQAKHPLILIKFNNKKITAKIKTNTNQVYVIFKITRMRPPCVWF